MFAKYDINPKLSFNFDIRQDLPLFDTIKIEYKCFDFLDITHEKFMNIN